MSIRIERVMAALVRHTQRRCVRSMVGGKPSTTVDKEKTKGKNTRMRRLVARAVAEAQKQEEDIDVDLVWEGGEEEDNDE